MPDAHNDPNNRWLAIENTSDACSVALLDNGNITELFEVASRQHTQKILPMIHRILADAGVALHQLDAIACSRGPGSFTSLRIGLSVVQGLAFSTGIPVLPISSLSVLAQTALDQQLVTEKETLLLALDARMDQVYWASAHFNNGLAVLDQTEQLAAPEQIPAQDWGADHNKLGHVNVGVGSGFCYAERMACYAQLQRVHDQVLPCASSLIRLARKAFAEHRYCAADQLLPVYLRNDVSWKKMAAAR